MQWKKQSDQISDLIGKYFKVAIINMFTVKENFIKRSERRYETTKESFLKRTNENNGVEKYNNGN